MRPVATQTGWVFIHPNGRIETDYFHNLRWMDNGKVIGRKVWHKKYRPDCEMFEAVLTVVK